MEEKRLEHPEERQDEKQEKKKQETSYPSCFLFLHNSFHCSSNLLISSL